MIVWVDAQLSPALAPWLGERFNVSAFSVQHLGYRDATDAQIFEAARAAGAVVLTKDSDFLRLLEQHGPPPQVLWVTVGNTLKREDARSAGTNFHASDCDARQWRDGR